MSLRQIAITDAMSLSASSVSRQKIVARGGGRGGRFAVRQPCQVAGQVSSEPAPQCPGTGVEGDRGFSLWSCESA